MKQLDESLVAFLIYWYNSGTTIVYDQSHKILCHYIKSKRQLKNVPLISSSTNPKLKQIADDCKAEADLERPFDLTYLLDLVAFQLYGFDTVRSYGA